MKHSEALYSIMSTLDYYLNLNLHENTYISEEIIRNLKDNGLELDEDDARSKV